MPWLEASFRHKVGDFRLSVTFSMERETAVFFGPSGAGKSQTLRLLAGLVRPVEGRFVLDGRTLFDKSRGVNLPSRFRDVGLVFQELALFPHLTLARNVSYGMTGHGPEVRRRAIEWLDRVGLAHRADDRPDQLSGGQRQRVAIVRALAARPKLLLLDEPFSALDGPLRRSLRRQLKALQRETGTAMIYVTHSVEDLAALGDRAFLFRDGSIRATAAGPQGLNAHWHELGWGNLLTGRVEARPDGHWFVWSDGRFLLPRADRPEGPAELVLPPDGLRLVHPDVPLDYPLSANRLVGTVLEAYCLARSVNLCVAAAGREWQVLFEVGRYAELDLSVGASIELTVPPESLQVLPIVTAPEGANRK